MPQPLYTPVLLFSTCKAAKDKKQQLSYHAIKVSHFLKIYIYIRQVLKIMLLLRPFLSACKNPDLRCMGLGLWVLELVADA